MKRESLTRGVMAELTPLDLTLLAIRGSHKKSLKTLLDILSKSMVLEESADALLREAVELGDDKVFETVMNHMDDVSFTPKLDCKWGDGEKTPLHLACSLGHAGIVAMLMRRGACDTMRDADGLTPIDLACIWGHSAAANEIIIRRMYPRAYYSHLMLLAIRNERSEVAKMLLDHIEDVDDDLILLAVKEACSTVVSKILEKVDDVAERCSELLTVAIRADRSDTALVLISRGANLRLESKDGLLPIHVAGPEVMKEMLRLDSTLAKTKDRKMQTPLHHAVARGCVESVVILAPVSNLDAENDCKMTPLMVSVVRGHFEISLCLLRVGSNVNLADDNGDTPLHAACRLGDASSARLLLSFGANVNARNIKGETPFMTAISYGQHGDIALLLIEFGFYPAHGSFSRGSPPSIVKHSLRAIGRDLRRSFTQRRADALIARNRFVRLASVAYRRSLRRRSDDDTDDQASSSSSSSDDDAGSSSSSAADYATMIVPPSSSAPSAL